MLSMLYVCVSRIGGRSLAHLDYGTMHRQILIVAALAISVVAFAHGLMTALSFEPNNELFEMMLSLAVGLTALTAAWLMYRSWFEGGRG